MCKMFGLCIKKAWQNKQVSQNNLYEYLFSPCITTTIFCLLNRNQDIKLILAGVSIMILWSTNIYECAYMVIDEKVYGTLGNILLSPFPTQFILFSEALSSVVFNVPVIFMVFITTYWICPYTIEPNNIMWFAVAYILCILSIASISIFLATLLLLTRSARGIMNIIEYPFFILSGLLVPIEKLPVCVQWVAKLIPSTHAFYIFRITLNGNMEMIWGSVINCFVTIVLLQLFTNIVIHYTKKQILVKGIIDIY